jgi:hypothetical protein
MTGNLGALKHLSLSNKISISFLKFVTGASGFLAYGVKLRAQGVPEGPKYSKIQVKKFE